MLEIKNLSYTYDDIKILDNVNITLEKNKIVSILGGSGVGKSTLFNVISGILPIQEGEITIDGSKDILSRISYMLQKDLLFPHKTIVDNVALPLIIAKMPKKEARKKALSLLDSFNLAEYANYYPHNLSGGMRQRVALLRTYMFNRDIILLDEAFSALDAITRSTMHEWYLDWVDKMGISTLIITHDINEAILLSDKIYVLANRPATVVLELDINIKNRSVNITEDENFNKYKNILLKFLNLQ